MNEPYTNFYHLPVFTNQIKFVLFSLIHDTCGIFVIEREKLKLFDQWAAKHCCLHSSVSSPRLYDVSLISGQHCSVKLKWYVKRLAGMTSVQLHPVTRRIYIVPNGEKLYVLTWHFVNRLLTGNHITECNMLPTSVIL